MKKILFALAILLPFPALAQADVVAAGEAIAAALNKRDAEALTRLLDADAVIRLVMKDAGLNASDREAVRKGLPRALRTNSEINVRNLETSKGTAKFLRAGARDGRTHALVRYDLGDEGIDYVEYYLTPGRKVEDWYVHSQANLYTNSVRFDIATMLKSDSMLYGFIGSKLTTQADIKPFTDLRQRIQAQDFAGAYRVLESFPESYRGSRQWALMRVTYGGRVDEATHRAALRHLAKNFGNEPDLQFMLIDHYFFEQQFDRALAALAALERAIGGEDGATANLRGSILIAAKRFDDAAPACRRGMAVEPDHKPAYWCLVTVGIGSKSGKLAVEGLKAYEKAFAIEFDLDKLAGLEQYREIARTPEFAAWAKTRR